MPNEPITVPQSFVAGTRVPQTFPELLQLYKAKEADAVVDLNGNTDPFTRPGLEIRKNGAIQALPGLRAELIRLVEQNSGAIFLTGSKEGVESFIGVAQDLTDGAIVVVSAKDLYVELGKYIDRGIRVDRRFSMDTMNSYVDGVMRILDKLSVDGIPAPNLVSNLNKVFPDLDSVVALARESLQGMKAPNGVTVGDGLNAIYLQLRAAEEAIKEGVATPFLPVIVLDATPEETKGSLFETLFFGRNVAFEVKGEVDQNSVVKTFTNLKKRRGPRQNQKG